MLRSFGLPPCQYQWFNGNSINSKANNYGMPADITPHFCSSSSSSSARFRMRLFSLLFFFLLSFADPSFVRARSLDLDSKRKIAQGMSSPSSFLLNKILTSSLNLKRHTTISYSTSNTRLQPIPIFVLGENCLSVRPLLFTNAIDPNSLARTGTFSSVRYE